MNLHILMKSNQKNMKTIRFIIVLITVSNFFEWNLIRTVLWQAIIIIKD